MSRDSISDMRCSSKFNNQLPVPVLQAVYAYKAATSGKLQAHTTSDAAQFALQCMHKTHALYCIHYMSHLSSGSKMRARN
eukprot:5002-Heterococcus_DN1.PRE.5